MTQIAAKSSSDTYDLSSVSEENVNLRGIILTNDGNDLDLLTYF